MRRKHCYKPALAVVGICALNTAAEEQIIAVLKEHWPVRVRRTRLRTIIRDNGPEFTSEMTLLWSKQSGTTLHFIQPGKPTPGRARLNYGVR